MWLARIVINFVFHGRIEDFELVGGTFDFTFFNQSGFSIFNGLCCDMDQYIPSHACRKKVSLLLKILFILHYHLPWIVVLRNSRLFRRKAFEYHTNSRGVSNCTELWQFFFSFHISIVTSASKYFWNERGENLPHPAYPSPCWCLAVTTV